MGIEPTQSAWKAEVLPLNYTRMYFRQEVLYNISKTLVNYFLPKTYGKHFYQKRMRNVIHFAYALYLD